jgi:hypothetical protein
MMLCDICSRIPYSLFLRGGRFQNGTLHQLRQTAKAGCGVCELIDDSFNLQGRRGHVRHTGDRNVMSEYVELARSESAILPILQLLYGDDIGQTDEEPLWYDILF